jgi:phosphoglycerol transferase MdoB-like AlkP superfamily enzyme
MDSQESTNSRGGSLGKARVALRGLGRVVLGPRVLPLVATALAGLVMFSLSRAILVLARLESIETLQGAHIANCFLVGLRFDAIVVGYGLLPLAVVLGLLPGRRLAGPGARRWVSACCAALLTVAAAMEVVGSAYFLHSGLRPSAQAIGHFGHFRECALYIWRTYPVLLIVGGWAGLFLLLRLAISRLTWPADADDRLPPWARGVLTAVLVSLCVLGCRGGVDHEPLRLGSAYFSTNRMISQLTMNNFCTVLRAARQSLNEERGDREVFDLPSPGPAAAMVAGMLQQKAQVALGAPQNPLWRGCDTGKPMAEYNVVVLLMESMAGKYVGLSGYQPSQTPNLDALAAQGLRLDRLYAVGPRTNRGLVGVLCGHPDVGGVSVLHRPSAVGRFLTLPGIFQRRGYRTLFVYGGDPEFDNMRKFFSRGGIDEFVVPPARQIEGQMGNWGQSDEQTFTLAHDAFEAMGDRKFFAVILTVSNHEPFDIPPGRVPLVQGRPEQVGPLNGVRYADWALGEYFRLARRSEYFERTIFVLVADHGCDFDGQRLLDVPGYRVPCVIYAPGIVKPGVVSATASQTDIAPTLLGLLGGRYEHGFMGRDLLSVEAKDGFALLREEDRLAFIRGDVVAVLPPRRELVLFKLSAHGMTPLSAQVLGGQDRQMLRLQMLSFCATADYLYEAGAYRDPDLVRNDVARR